MIQINGIFPHFMDIYTSLKCYTDNEIKCYLNGYAVLKTIFPKKRDLGNTKKKAIPLNKYTSTREMTRRKHIKMRTAILLGW